MYDFDNWPDSSIEHGNKVIATDNPDDQFSWEIGVFNGFTKKKLACVNTTTSIKFFKYIKLLSDQYTEKIVETNEINDNILKHDNICPVKNSIASSNWLFKRIITTDRRRNLFIDSDGMIYRYLLLSNKLSDIYYSDCFYQLGYELWKPKDLDFLDQYNIQLYGCNNISLFKPCLITMGDAKNKSHMFIISKSLVRMDAKYCKAMEIGTKLLDIENNVITFGFLKNGKVNDKHDIVKLLPDKNENFIDNLKGKKTIGIEVVYNDNKCKLSESNTIIRIGDYEIHTLSSFKTILRNNLDLKNPIIYASSILDRLPSEYKIITINDLDQYNYFYFGNNISKNQIHDIESLKNTNIKKDDPILYTPYTHVSMATDHSWRQGHFARIVNNEIYIYTDGKTSETGKGEIRPVTHLIIT